MAGTPMQEFVTLALPRDLIPKCKRDLRGMNTLARRHEVAIVGRRNNHQS